MSTPIGHFLNGEYEVTRSTGGYYKDGYYVENEPETITIIGSLQPLNPREDKMPEEGERLKQMFKFYSTEPLLTLNTKSLAESDVVTINGDTFKVVAVEKWSNEFGFGGVDFPHYKTLLQREPQQ